VISNDLPCFNVQANSNRKIESRFVIEYCPIKQENRENNKNHLLCGLSFCWLAETHSNLLDSTSKVDKNFVRIEDLSSGIRHCKAFYSAG
jgi:hypothetical protein